MDDYEAHQVGSDNPAQSVPAAQRVLPKRKQSNGHTTATAKQAGSFQKIEVSLTKYDV
jgi:hypothetical protein